MESIIDLAGKTWDFLVSLISSVSIFDLLDIAVVAVLLYFIYVFIRDRRAGKLAAGVVILVLLQLIAELLELNAMRFIMQNVFQVGLLALVVVFQPELRSALEKVGGEPLRSLKSIGEIRDKNDPAKSAAWIKPLCDAVTDMAADRTGALIVIEQTTPLGDVAAGGIIVNADMNSYMLKNIFFNKAPLHDGAVIIRGGRIWAASCFLPDLDEQGDCRQPRHPSPRRDRHERKQRRICDCSVGGNRHDFNRARGRAAQRLRLQQAESGA